MTEMVVRISEDGKVMVERFINGLKSFKQIAPDSLLECINRSILRGTVSSGILPRNCLSYTAHDNGGKDVCIVHMEDRFDVSFYGTSYTGFPLPRLVFGFNISKEGRISQCKLGVVANEQSLRPTTPMFVYPFSHVSGFSLCIGNNPLPKCTSLHTLASLPYLILAMPNIYDHYGTDNNRLGLEMRDLLEVLKGKGPEFYYSDVLVPSGKVLNDFIAERG